MYFPDPDIPMPTTKLLNDPKLKRAFGAQIPGYPAVEYVPFEYVPTDGLDRDAAPTDNVENLPAMDVDNFVNVNSNAKKAVQNTRRMDLKTSKLASIEERPEDDEVGAIETEDEREGRNDGDGDGDTISDSDDGKSESEYEEYDGFEQSVLSQVEEEENIDVPMMPKKDTPVRDQLMPSRGRMTVSREVKGPVLMARDAIAAKRKYPMSMALKATITAMAGGTGHPTSHGPQMSEEGVRRKEMVCSRRVIRSHDTCHRAQDSNEGRYVHFFLLLHKVSPSLVLFATDTRMDASSLPSLPLLLRPHQSPITTRLESAPFLWTWIPLPTSCLPHHSTSQKLLSTRSRRSRRHRHKKTSSITASKPGSLSPQWKENQKLSVTNCLVAPRQAFSRI